MDKITNPTLDNLSKNLKTLNAGRHHFMKTVQQFQQNIDVFMKPLKQLESQRDQVLAPLKHAEDFLKTFEVSVSRAIKHAENNVARLSPMTPASDDRAEEQTDAIIKTLTQLKFGNLHAELEFQSRIEAKLDRIIELLEEGNSQAKT